MLYSFYFHNTLKDKNSNTKFNETGTAKEREKNLFKYNNGATW